MARLFVSTLLTLGLLGCASNRDSDTRDHDYQNRDRHTSTKDGDESWAERDRANVNDSHSSARSMDSDRRMRGGDRDRSHAEEMDDLDNSALTRDRQYVRHNDDRPDMGSHNGGRDMHSDNDQMPRPDRDRRDHEGDGDGDPASGADASFLKDAWKANMTEIEAGNVALSRAQRADVRECAQKIVDDHTRNNREVMSLAGRLNVDLPDQLDGHHRDMIEDLRKEDAGSFDKKYTKMMVEDHKKVISKFERQAKDSKNAEVRDYASRTLPALRAHQERAKQVQERM